MSKIESLTTEQEKQLEVHRDRYIKLGLDCTPIDEQKAAGFAEWLYKKMNRDRPTLVFLDNPLSTWTGVILLNNLQNNDWQQVKEQVWSQVISQIHLQVWEVLEPVEQVWQHVEDRVWEAEKQALDQVWYSVLEPVKRQIREQIRDQVRQQVEEQVWNFIWPYLDGQFFVSDLPLHDYCHDVLKVAMHEDYLQLRKVMHFNLIYPLTKFCIFCEKPLAICRNNSNQLHNEKGPALSYPGDWHIYALNGVRLPRELVETPADQLDPAIILKIRNAEIRRELVRKLGMQRIFKTLKHKIIESQEDYRLVEIDLQDGRRRPYLFMKNPSIDTWHIEGVPPEIKTIESALAWRNDMRTWVKPAILT